jgi:hypothetical protein
MPAAMNTGPGIWMPASSSLRTGRGSSNPLLGPTVEILGGGRVDCNAAVRILAAERRMTYARAGHMQ